MRSHPCLRPLPGNGSTDDEVEIGLISGVFGVKGEVRLYLHNPESDTFAEPTRAVLIDPQGNRFECKLSARTGAGKRILGRIEGLDDRDFAETLKDWQICVAEADLPEVDDDEFYVYELVGMSVVIGAQEVGTVAVVHNTPGGDLLEIAVGNDVRFVPIVERFVQGIDLETRQIRLVEDALEEP